MQVMTNRATNAVVSGRRREIGRGNCLTGGRPESGELPHCGAGIGLAASGSAVTSTGTSVIMWLPSRLGELGETLSVPPRREEAPRGRQQAWTQTSE